MNGKDQICRLDEQSQVLQLKEAKGICVAYDHHGINPWETEVFAKHMRAKLAKQLKTEPLLQISRQTVLYTGYYVYLKSV